MAKITFKEHNPHITELSGGIYLLNVNLKKALSIIGNINLGNCIYLFDPLRSVEWSSIEQVAIKRITSYYKTGTEFFVFLFTSDWFLGRDDFAALPVHSKESLWNNEESRTVKEADELFGDKEWRDEILKDYSIDDRQKNFVEKYRLRLNRWFRYVLPLPFNPKANEIFHLIVCSNYDAGIRRIKDAYAYITGNPRYSPDNRKAYDNFKELHPELTKGLKDNRRPEEWKLLWKVIRNHEEGLCDETCNDFMDIDSIRSRLNWLRKNEYIVDVDLKKPWKNSTKTFKLNWNKIIRQLGISPPQTLQPIPPENARIRHLFDITN